MQAGLGGPDGNTECRSRLRQRQLQKEAQDDHSSLLGFEARERTLEKVPIGDLRRHVSNGRLVENGELHLDDPPASSPGLVEAGIDREAVEPWPEPVRVAQPGQVSPGSHHRILDRVARELRVPQDESGSRVQPRDRRVDERDEGVMIAPLRPFHESSLVHSHPIVPARPEWSRSIG